MNHFSIVDVIRVIGGATTRPPTFGIIFGAKNKHWWQIPTDSHIWWKSCGANIQTKRERTQPWIVPLHCTQTIAQNINSFQFNFQRFWMFFVYSYLRDVLFYIWNSTPKLCSRFSFSVEKMMLLYIYFVASLEHNSLYRL